MLISPLDPPPSRRASQGQGETLRGDERLAASEPRRREGACDEVAAAASRSDAEALKRRAGAGPSCSHPGQSAVWASRTPARDEPPRGAPGAGWGERATGARSPRRAPGPGLAAELTRPRRRGARVHACEADGRSALGYRGRHGAASASHGDGGWGGAGGSPARGAR